MPFPVSRSSDSGYLEPMQVDLVGDGLASPEEDFIVESSTLDVDYISMNYTGLAKLRRLLFMAKHCPSLELDALRAAHDYVKETYNVKLYKEIMVRYIQASSQSNQNEVPVMDNNWVEVTFKNFNVRLEHLDTDLKNHKSNTIKESIRRGHEDLGNHHLECGDLNNALKCYSRSRDYCSVPKHIINMCLNVIKVGALMGNWAQVLNFVNKAESSMELLGEQREKPANLIVATKLKCAAGLAELALKKYKPAAKYFLQASFDHCEYKELISPHDVAVYGGLCALASFDRQELRTKVLSNSSFKLFLELDPQIRDVLYKFYESQYASCLKTLDEIKENFRLDVHLSPHVNSLYSQIRNRALIQLGSIVRELDNVIHRMVIVYAFTNPRLIDKTTLKPHCLQYFSPYVSADMGKMAESFNTTVPALEDELTQLILDDQIPARIDSHNKILFAREVDQRSTTFEKAMKMGKEYDKRVKTLIIRAAVISSQIYVKSPPRDANAVDSGSR